VQHSAGGCYTATVPTTRPRHVVTETDPVARALDDAARHWPADRDNRARLVLRLVEEGHRALRDQVAAQVAQRRDAVEGTSGAVTGAYGTDYLDRLRAEWPQ